jgi:hypothetical protein
MTDAPSCPISYGQTPYKTRLLRGGDQISGRPPRYSAIPPAFDLPSLIRTTNALRDVLRQLTTSLTVNNIAQAQFPRPPRFKAEGDTHYSDYPEWGQISVDNSVGFVYHKRRDKTKDPSQRVYVVRINRVTFQNQTQEDKDFIWSYSKKLDATTG